MVDGMSHEVILPSDPRAAEQVTVTLWRSRTGRLYDREDTARHDGSTHGSCEDCGAACDKMWTSCRACRDNRALERWEKRERRPWNGNPLYSEAMNDYFNDLDDVETYLDGDSHIDDLRLVQCEPVYPRAIDGDRFFDDLPEDGEIPEALSKAMDAFNAAVKGIVLSYTPGKYRLEDAT